MKTTLSILVGLSSLFIGVVGCSTPNNASHYIDPHNVVFAGDLDHVKRLFSGSGQENVFQTLEDAQSHWLFISSFPYRGRSMFDVYVFEKPKTRDYGGEYTLRSLVVVYNSQHFTAEFKSEREGVAVFHEGRMVSWIGHRD